MQKLTGYSLHNLRVQGDKIVVITFWGLVLLSFGLANIHSTWTAALLVGVPCGLISTMASVLRPGSVLSRLTNAAISMILSALLIPQMHGMIEMHFGIFSLLAFLLYYRDWKPLVMAAGVTAAQELAGMATELRAVIGKFRFDSANVAVGEERYPTPSSKDKSHSFRETPSERPALVH
jgi:hypothetical protein